MARDISAELHNAVAQSIRQVNVVADAELSVDTIGEQVRKERAFLNDSLGTEDWRKHFRGRDILRKFAGKYGRGTRYEHFRNLIISRMMSAGHQPPGMKTVLEQIISD